MRIASIVSPTRVEGPGKRIAIWVQGCSIKCEGCFNPELWGTRGGINYNFEAFLQKVVTLADLDPEIEGITFLGGEPFDQAVELAPVAARIQELGLTVMVFTGFTLLELESGTILGSKEFLRSIDLLVDGKFEKELLDIARPWLGSTNQKFHFLTKKYDLHSVVATDKLEVNVTKDGKLTINGWAKIGLIENLISPDLPIEEVAID